MGDFIKNSRLATQTNDMLASLHLARTEAIKRNARVTVCKSANASAATPACDTTIGASWDIGWIVFIDSASFGTREAPAEVLLDSHPRVGNSVVIAPRDMDVTVPDYISYTSRGVVRQADGVTAQSGVFRVCDDRGLKHARGVVLSPTGRIEVTTSILQLDPDDTGSCS